MIKNEKLTPKTFMKRISKKKSDENKIFSDENYLKYLSIEKLYDKKKDSEYYYNLKHLINSTSSSEISDALFSLTNNNGVLEGLKSISGLKAYGRVVTSETSADDWGTSTLAIDEAEEGEVIFIKTQPVNYSEDSNFKKMKGAAVWGELTSLAAKSKKIAGTFVWGYVRDIDNLTGLNYPVFALDTCPNAGVALGQGTINKSIHLANHSINQGDFIFGDKSGVVLVPNALFGSVMKKVIDIKRNEKNIREDIRKGRSLSEITELK
ncbi:MAG: RraA family protein [Methanobrevibacter sp.]|jgi:regulator of RNase E activity RraA|nr:RraA family protein [Candidatus Methanovirga australis]